MIFASFDLDGTITNTLDLIVRGMKGQGFRPVNDDTRKSFFFRFEKGYAPPPDFMWDIFFYRLFTEQHDEIELVDDHVEKFLQSVYDVGQEPIRIITSRPEGALMHWSCQALLKRLLPDIKFSIDVVPCSSDKIKYTLGTDIFFDDRRKTVIEMSEAGQIVFMRNTSYNDLGLRKYMQIEDVALMDLGPGDIVVYDNFKQLIELNVRGLIAPF